MLLDDKACSLYLIIFLISDRSGQICGVVETLISAPASQSYFELEQLMVDSSESISIVSHLEFNHIAYISSVDGVRSVNLWEMLEEGNKIGRAHV